MAKLHFKYGAMNSGKSDTLIKTAYNYDERGLATLTVKPALDTKGEDWVVARGGARRRVDVLTRPEDDLRARIHAVRSEEHTSELQSRGHLVCRLLLEKKKKRRKPHTT